MSENKSSNSTKSNIILIGMPGAGKSTIGVIAAKMLGKHFMDTDIRIQEQTGKLLSEIIEDEGVEGFLQTENNALASLFVTHAVIATGGSAVYGAEGMAHLKKIGTVVYLHLSYEAVAERLGDLKMRGVVLKDGQDLRALYEERTPLYQQYADIIINEDGLNVEETLAELVRQVNAMV